MSGNGGLTILFDRIGERVEREAAKGAAEAARYALERIRSHAPVRKIFRGTTYHETRLGFRAPINRRVVADGEERTGHANSFLPLLRIRTAGGATGYATGDFRRVETRPGPNQHDLNRQGYGQLAEITSGARSAKMGRGGRYSKEGSEGVQDLAVFVTKGGRTTKLVNPAPLSGETVKVTGGRALTGRGRYEVRSGRANHIDEAGVTRVGGRLRAGLHIEGPVDEGGIQWWYVVSDTKDPVTGRLYPRDQEFGTRHNKPHPFMRPGLHETRAPFKRAVRRAISEGLRKR